MKLLAFNWNPTDRQLRQFGFIAWAFIPMICWFWTHQWSSTLYSLLAGFVIALLGTVAPRALKPVFLTLSILTFPIGLVLSELALLFLYFGIFLPIGIVFRITKRDALLLKFDRSSKTYWIATKVTKKPASYFRQS